MAGIAGDELPHIYILDADLKESVRDNEIKPSLYGEIDKLHKRLVAGLSDANKPRLKQLYAYGSGTPIANQQSFGEYLIGSPSGGRGKGPETRSRRPFRPGRARSSDRRRFLRPTQRRRHGDLRQAIFRQSGQHSDRPQASGHATKSTAGGSDRLDLRRHRFGGAPVIAQQLRTWAGEKSSIRIGVFLTLPWFSPGDLGKTFTDTRDTQGKWETQVKNTAAGLRFYGTSKVFLSHVDVFLADYNGEKHARRDDSNTGQPEYPHCFNLILAAQIQNYLTRDIPTEEIPRQYSFYFLARATERPTMKLNGHDSALLRFSARALRQDLAEWARQTQTLRLALEKIADFINRGFRLQDAGVRDRPQTFRDLVMALATNCTYLPKPIIGTGPFYKRRSDASPQVYGSLAKALNERGEQLGFIIAWLR
ncbi:MAG: hypothetical protein ACRERU_22610 [Methylococcales bacterium]